MVRRVAKLAADPPNSSNDHRAPLSFWARLANGSVRARTTRATMRVDATDDAHSVGDDVRRGKNHTRGEATRVTITPPPSAPRLAAGQYAAPERPPDYCESGARNRRSDASSGNTSCTGSSPVPRGRMEENRPGKRPVSL